MAPVAPDATIASGSSSSSRERICDTCATPPSLAATRIPSLNTGPEQEAPQTLRPCLHNLGAGNPHQICCIHSCYCRPPLELIPLGVTARGHGKGKARVLGIPIPMPIVTTVMRISPFRVGEPSSKRAAAVATSTGTATADTFSARGSVSETTASTSLVSSDYELTETSPASMAAYATAVTVSEESVLARRRASSVFDLYGSESGDEGEDDEHGEGGYDEDQALLPGSGGEEPSSSADSESLSLHHYHSFPDFKYNKKKHCCSVL